MSTPLLFVLLTLGGPLPVEREPLASLPQLVCTDQERAWQLHIDEGPGIGGDVLFALLDAPREALSGPRPVERHPCAP